MAVTTQTSSNPQYMLAGNNLPNCIGGGEDYRTLNNSSTEDFLYIRGFCGDNISDACLIMEVKITGCYCKLTNSSGGYATALVSGQVRRSAVLSKGSVSGTTFNRAAGTTLECTGEYVHIERNSTTAIADYVFSYRTRSTEFCQANNTYPGVKVEFKSSNNVRAYIKWINITVTRTRACYITFKGDGVTESKTMYDYGSVPSYGSTPSRSGYIFKGWNDGSTTHTGTLPTAYETDVTYTAVWEVAKTNKIYIGTAQPQEICIGNQKAKAVYVGTTKIYG